MRLLSFTVKGSERVGVLIGEGRILDLAGAYSILFEHQAPGLLYNLKALIESQARGLDLARLVETLSIKELKANSPLGERLVEGAVFSFENVTFNPPVKGPGKILCMAVNYWSHAREMSTEPPESPYLFIKLASTLVGHKGSVIIPRGAEKPDHEVELAVVIGGKGKYIDRGKAMDHVFGYTILNDITLRGRQTPLKKGARLGIRWLPAKNFDTSAPLGPIIVTADEIGDPHNLKLQLKVNGELRQDGHTSDMIFKIPEIIEAASEGLTLEPGDIISTGTPSGVGAATGKFLRHGDIIEAWIENIGSLENTVFYEV
ncbi:MAG: fumarylacetoacetate hydrolase family protein [Thermoprotei archaeon]|nr:fumarylacetoacetate hydrolase family protein [Thermoprotei archaeon]